jgi:pyruvate,orthophosphate dikinase
VSETVQPIVLGRDATPPASVVGAKAAELARMMALGLRVPAAFALPTRLCAGVIADDPAALAAMRNAAAAGITSLEAATGKRFGDARTPLLVSVRSGAERSMPGMLDTVLDVGLNPATLHGLIRQSGDVRLAFDSYRRFLFAYAETVCAAPTGAFEAALARLLQTEGVADEAELDSEALERLAGEYRALAERLSATPSDDPMEQLVACARAVYKSWEIPRAREYRRLNGLEGLSGTAVTVQAMVFGNSGADSGAGVAFSRNPATGEKALYIDFLSDAQGEDVVSGRRTPGDAAELSRRMPGIARELEAGARLLESAHSEVQDIEFTVERGLLYFLQARSAKRTPQAALKIAVDLVGEGVISRAQALERLASVDLAATRVGRFAAAAKAAAHATVASPGVACGRVCFDSLRARALADAGEPVILVRRDTSTDDIEGFAVASGVLTAVGGRTSHAAVVARQMGKVCLVGCLGLNVDADSREAMIGSTRIREGDWIALDGSSGDVSVGRREVVFADAPEAAVISQWREGEAPR